MEKKLRAMALSMRRNILKMALAGGTNGAHLGGALSCVEILAVLYGAVMRVEPASRDRDYFILSKGHCAIAQYAALREAGLLTDEELDTFEANGGILPGHTVRNDAKGIEISSGSLGLGLGFGVGLARGIKLAGGPSRVFVLMGNGECDEGSVWEAAMLGASLGLGGLTAIVDDNGMQLDGDSSRIMRALDIKAAFAAFGWRTIEADGADITALLSALRDTEPDHPTALIVRTTKGRGVSFMENSAAYHHATLTRELYDSAMKELASDERQ